MFQIFELRIPDSPTDANYQTFGKAPPPLLVQFWTRYDYVENIKSSIRLIYDASKTIFPGSGSNWGQWQFDNNFNFQIPVNQRNTKALHFFTSIFFLNSKNKILQKEGVKYPKLPLCSTPMIKPAVNHSCSVSTQSLLRFNIKVDGRGMEMKIRSFCVQKLKLELTVA